MKLIKPVYKMVKGGSNNRQHRLKRRSKAKFKGNRHSVLSKAVVDDSVSQVVQRVGVDFAVNSEHEQTVSCAKLKKHKVPSVEKNVELGYSIIDISVLSGLINSISCPVCKQEGLELAQVKKQAFSIQYCISCPCKQYEKLS